MKKLKIIAALAAAIFISALLLFDFHISVSSTAQNISMTRISGGNGSAEQKERIPFLTSPLRIVSDDPKLSQSLARQISQIPGFDQVEVLNAIPEDTHQPVLIVRQTASERLWLVFFAKSAINVEMIFASDGQWDSNHIEMQDGQPGVVRLTEKMDLADRSVGIMSRPWYLRHLREEITKQVINALKNDLEQPVD